MFGSFRYDLNRRVYLCNRSYRPRGGDRSAAAAALTQVLEIRYQIVLITLFMFFVINVSHSFAGNQFQSSAIIAADRCR